MSLEPFRLIEFDDLSCGYDQTPVLEGVTLAIHAGQFVGVIGPSGSGKTTFLRSILGAVECFRGEVRVLGRSVGKRAPTRVGYVPQLETVDWNFPITVEQVVLLGLATESGPWPWARRGDRGRVHNLLDRLGIGAFASRHIRDLSGGQQQRLFLDRALVRDPELLLLDEPTSGVDIKTRDDILHLLAEIAASGVTIVLTTHELNAVAAHLPRVICLNRRVVAHGPPREVFTPEILSRTYGSAMTVVRHDDILLIADNTHFIPGEFTRAHPWTVNQTERKDRHDAS